MEEILDKIKNNRRLTKGVSGPEVPARRMRALVAYIGVATLLWLLLT